MHAKDLTGYKTYNELTINNGDITDIRVPNYQRTYKWGKIQIDDLWTSIMQTYEDEEEYFLGSIMLQEQIDKNNNDKPFVAIVDGQQRTITLSLVARIILAFAKTNNLSFDDQETETGKYIRELQSMFYSNGQLKISVQNKDADDFKSVMRSVSEYAEGLETIKEWVDKVDFDENEEIKETKLSAIRMNTIYLYKYVDKFVKDDLITGNHAPLYKLAKVITTYFKFIQASLKKEEDAYTIFSTMNSLGLSLSFSDLVKAWLGKNEELLEKKWEDFFEQKDNNDDLNFWDSKNYDESHIESFFNAYLWAKEKMFTYGSNSKQGKSINISSIRKDYEKKTSEHDFNAINEWNEIEKYAKNYKKIFELGKNPTIDKNTPFFHYLARLMVKFTAYPLVPIVIYCMSEEIFSNEYKEKVFELLAKVMIRERLRVGSLKASVLSFFKADDVGNNYETKNNDNGVFTNQDKFDKQPYNTRVKDLLMALEDRIRLDLCLNPLNTPDMTNAFTNWQDKLSAEHFSAKKGFDPEVDEEFKYKIGNLSILTQTANSKESNKPTNNKNLNLYGDLYINGKNNTNLVLKQKWTNEDVENRMEALRGLAKKYF